jgi:excisionase family DNA binding protein
MNMKLITERQLADWLAISKSTLHKLREQGELPFRLIGGCIRYQIDEVEAWLQRCGVNAPGDELAKQEDQCRPQ